LRNCSIDKHRRSIPELNKKKKKKKKKKRKTNAYTHVYVCARFQRRDISFKCKNWSRFGDKQIINEKKRKEKKKANQR